MKQAWKYLISFDNKFDYDLFFHKEGKTSIRRSQKKRCSMCDINSDLHEMQYRLIHCSSEAEMYIVLKNPQRL